MKVSNRLCALLLLALASAVQAAPPTHMAYQGRLHENGKPVNGNKTVIFRIYDVEVGGTALVTTSAQQVIVRDGAFTAALDLATVPVSTSGQLYLEVVIEGTTLTPRDPLRSVPSAVTARSVSGPFKKFPETGDVDVGGSKIINLGTPTANADAATKAYVDSLISASTAGIDMALLSATQTFTGQNTFSDTVNISSSLLVSGHVGIGTISPGQKLTVTGTIESTSGGFKFPDGTTQTTAGGPSILSGTNTFTGRNTYSKPGAAATDVILQVSTSSAGQELVTVLGGGVAIGTTTVGQSWYNQKDLVDIAGHLRIVNPPNQHGLEVYTNQDNAALTLTSSLTGGRKYQIYSTGGNSGHGQGVFLVRVYDAVTDPVHLRLDANGDFAVGGLFGPLASNSITGATLVGKGANVGIGNTNPGQKLSVAGTIESTTGGFKFPDGTTQTTAAGGGSGGAGLQSTQTFTAQQTFSNQMTVSSNVLVSGRLGIGTTSPVSPLTIYGANNPHIEMNSTDGSGYALHMSQGGVLKGSLGVNSSDTYLDSGSGSSMHVRAGAFTNHMVLLTNGNVGIGTNAASQRLTVTGTIESTTGGFKFPDGTTQTTAAGGGSGGAGLQSTQTFTAQQTFSNQMTVSSTVVVAGRLGIKTSSPTANLEISGPADIFVRSPFASGEASGLYFDLTVQKWGLRMIRPSAANSYFIDTVFDTTGGTADDTRGHRVIDVASGSVRFFVSGSGKVGVGTATPKSALHIASGDVYVPTISSGVILKSPDGTCYRVTVANGGAVQTASLTCP